MKVAKGNLARSIIRVLAIGMAITAMGASAADAQENYIAFHGGYVVTDNPDLYTFIGDIPHTLKSGYAMGLALGHDTGYGFRMELEGTYRTTPVETIGGLPATGDVVAISGMGNLIYDFTVYTRPNDPYSRSRLVPYLGVGGGGAYLDFQDVNYSGGDFADEGHWVPAVQGIAGIGLRLGGDAVLSIDYRYFKTFAGDFAGQFGIAFDAGYIHHTAMLSLRTPF